MDWSGHEHVRQIKKRDILEFFELSYFEQLTQTQKDQIHVLQPATFLDSFHFHLSNVHYSFARTERFFCVKNELKFFFGLLEISLSLGGLDLSQLGLT